MKVIVTEDGLDVWVVLSERNLKTLNVLWERALVGDALPVLHRHQGADGEDGRFVSVRIEPNEIHYADREMGAGPEDV